MNDVRFTRQKICPYCKNANVEYIDLSDILDHTDNPMPVTKIKKHIFRCKNCKELFYYTGDLVAEKYEQKVEK